MMKIPAIISVRSSSTRLPKKCFMKFGDFSVIEHIVQRCLHFDLDPIVCSTIEKSDDAIIDLAKKLDVKYFRGPELNKLLRWSQCCQYFDIKTFHTVDADDPFFDAYEMKRSMKLLLEKKLDMVSPTKSSSAGGASVGYSLTAEIVHKASDGLDPNADTEMMWYFIEKIPLIKMQILSEVENTLPKMRLTLDYEEDYWLLESVRKIVGNFATRDEVNQLFLRNPDFYKVNWFRNKQWKDAQLSKKF